MKIAITAALLLCSASAFAPATRNAVTSSLKAVPWSPDESAFAFGLPGSTGPIQNFDPFGFAKDCDYNTMLRYREAETQHGRVAMLAVIGFLITEEPIEFHPLFEADNKDIGPAIRHLDEVRAVSPFFFELFAVFIGLLELNRALIGWKAPGDDVKFQDIKDEYFPGDVSFDPLNLKPTDPEDFAAMSARELNNGRLAMIGVAGFIVQELINSEEIFVSAGLAPDRFDPSSVPIQF
jgi:light-harvesting complex I chlorophyll a/b binding protein 1